MQVITTIYIVDLALDSAGTSDGWRSMMICHQMLGFQYLEQRGPLTIRELQTAECTDEWLLLFGDEVLESKFQDGHYAYTVVAGGGSGDDVFPPVIYVVDVENAVDFNSVLEP